MLWVAAWLLVAAAPSPNVLLVTIDTLRADHVGAYRYALGATPTIDRLAREGVLLEDAVAQVPMTRPSHACLLTGRYPFEHGLRDNASGPLAAGTPTLASLMRARGYDTAAFVGAYPVSRPSGLDRGFDEFDDPFGGGEMSTTRAARSERPAAEVVDRAIQWLRKPRAAPFLLWVHLFDPHVPYEPPPPFRQRFAKSPYDGEIAYADAQLGRLIAALDATGRRASTLVIVTSDHGEGLGEHGENEHMLFVYDTTLHVPLVLSWPGTLPASARVRGQFRSIDLLPTVLALVGAPPAATSGASRAEILRAGGQIPDNESYAESLYGQLHFGYAPVTAIRTEGWKYVDLPRAELYRVSDDPHEEHNLLDTRASVAAALRTRLAALPARGTPTAAAPGAARVDPDAAERLAALGYLGGATAAATGASGADPKDKVREFTAYEQGMRDALRRFHDRDLKGAIRILEPLSRSSAESFNVEYYLGRSLLESGRHGDAVAPLQRAVALAPTVGAAYIHLARAYVGAGRPADARATLEQGLTVAPSNAELHYALGRLLLQAGAVAPARAALERAKALDARDARIRADLSTAYRNSGDVAKARAEAEEAVRLDARSSDARVALGLALGALGQETEAAAALGAALRLDPHHPDALFYLGIIDLRAGRKEEARQHLEALLARHPDYPGAREALAQVDR
jgi:choline-sulfatase